MNPDELELFRTRRAGLPFLGDRIRALHGEAAAAFRAFGSSRCLGVVGAERGFLVGFEELRDAAELPAADLWLEHPRLAVISHPYEWPFALPCGSRVFTSTCNSWRAGDGFSLRHASASNVQFERGLPLFIDLPFFAPYVEGEHWFGHRQFCEQFLNPLLLRDASFPHDAWYRGAPDGIATGDLYESCGWRDWLSPRHLMHILLPVRLQRWAAHRPSTVAQAAARPLPRTALRALLTGMRAGN